jgi:hypothetical protein
MAPDARRSIRKNLRYGEAPLGAAAPRYRAAPLRLKALT